MSGVGNDSTFGNLKSNYHFQLSLLQILKQVADNTASSGSGGVGYEFRITTYKATATVNPDYTTGDIISRTDIINPTNGVIASTLWFNETGGFQIGAVPIANITPYSPPSQITIGSGENHIGEFGKKITNVTAEYTRPADANAYAALDVYSNSTSAPAVLTFTSIARISGGSGRIMKAIAYTDQKTNTARFKLHLYNTSPTAINDNSPYLQLYANNASYVGSINFSAMTTEDPTNSTTAYSVSSEGSGNLPLAFLTSGSANLFGIVEIIDAFTPASGQKLYFSLTAECN